MMALEHFSSGEHEIAFEDLSEELTSTSTPGDHKMSEILLIILYSELLGFFII